MFTLRIYPVGITKTYNLSYLRLQTLVQPSLVNSHLYDICTYVAQQPTQKPNLCSNLNSPLYSSHFTPFHFHSHPSLILHLHLLTPTIHNTHDAAPRTPSPYPFSSSCPSCSARPSPPSASSRRSCCTFAQSCLPTSRPSDPWPPDISSSSTLTVLQRSRGI